MTELPGQGASTREPPHAPVSVTEVTYPDEGERLLGRQLDVPEPGSQGGRGYALDVRGWAVGRSSAVTEVELLDGDRSLRRVPVDIERQDVAASFEGAPGAGVSGFFLTCNTLRVAPRFELALRVTLADGGVAELARITGSRAPLRPTFEPSRKPLMVTTMGRTGSTMLMRLLAGHPDLVAVPPFEYEPKVASYWLEVLLALSDPASYRRQLASGRNLTERWWLGDPTPLPRPIGDDELAAWLGADAIVELADFCLARVEALYARVAAEQGKEEASFFAEKYWAASTAPAFARELYPASREVFVVRDFRDMLASMYAYNEMKGYVGFGRQFAASDREHVADLGRRASLLLAGYRSRADRAALVRYEDLVGDPDGALTTLLGRLELDPGPATVSAMREGLRRSETGSHMTTEDPEQSIGRWRRDLPPELRDAAEEAFAPALEGFGYE
jgi:hypothetical protein